MHHPLSDFKLYFGPFLSLCWPQYCILRPPNLFAKDCKCEKRQPQKEVFLHQLMAQKPNKSSNRDFCFVPACLDYLPSCAHLHILISCAAVLLLRQSSLILFCARLLIVSLSLSLFLFVTTWHFATAPECVSIGGCIVAINLLDPSPGERATDEGACRSGVTRFLIRFTLYRRASLQERQTQPSLLENFCLKLVQRQSGRSHIFAIQHSQGAVGR